MFSESINPIVNGRALNHYSSHVTPHVRLATIGTGVIRKRL
jgi:hypothetical protein